jgi:hypothetical protein
LIPHLYHLENYKWKARDFFYKQEHKSRETATSFARTGR